MADYIPESDSAALDWARNLVTYSTGHTAETGYSPADITAMTDALKEFDSGLTDHVRQHAAARAARQRKDEARKKLESVIRPRVRKVQADPAVTAATLRGMGLRPRDTERTPVAIPATRPTGIIDTSQRFIHTIRFWDSESGRRAKPKGIVGCQIWIWIGNEESAKPEFLGNAMRSPYVHTFEGEVGGMQAHYMLRWFNARGDGPWSETLTATIPA